MAPIEPDAYQLGDVVVLPHEAYGRPAAAQFGRTVRFFASSAERLGAKAIDLVAVSLAQLCSPFLVVGVLDALWLLWDRPRRQCLHDKAAKTFVVRA